MYCSGIPILYPFAFVFFTINYWMFKYLVLKFYRTTTEFNEELAVLSIPYMQIGFLLHAVTTLMMYSNSETMKFSPPSKKNYFKDIQDYATTGQYPSLATPVDDSVSQKVDNRFFRWNYTEQEILERFFNSEVSQKLVILYLVMLLVYAAYRIFMLVSLICPRAKKRVHAKESLLEEVGRSNNFYREISIDTLKDLYKEVIYQIEMRQKMKFPIERFESMNEFRLEHEPRFSMEDPTKFHLDYLNKKKHQIEQTIDDHVASVDPAGEHKQMSYLEKLSFLKENSGKLELDKSRCRMKAITQSYDMFDCKEYQQIREVKKMIQRHNDQFGDDYSHFEITDDNTEVMVSASQLMSAVV